MKSLDENKETNAVKQVRYGPARLDEVDRTLLGLLAQDSSRSYAELSEILHLSAPAIHERVKRLKREENLSNGTIADELDISESTVRTLLAMRIPGE